MKSFEERLSGKVEITGFCWVWTGAKTALGHLAYGSVMGATGRNTAAHRWVYEHLVGQIPPGMVLDHLCRVRLCVNPDHLEPVSQRENLRRGSHSYVGVMSMCKRGHDLRDPQHQHFPATGRRVGQVQCRTCISIRNREHARTRKRVRR